MKANEILRDAAKILEERGKLRDTPEGERSMARAVSCYQSLRGDVLQGELDGWLFMCCLKMARATAGNVCVDDWTDLAGYAALGAECVSESEDEPAEKAEDSSGWIDYDGSGQPVSDDTLVFPVLRSGCKFTSPVRADCLSWSRGASFRASSDIVAYKVAVPAPKPASYIGPEGSFWIERDAVFLGFPLPFTKRDDRLRVWLRSGEKVVGEMASFQWEERDDENDIIAYQYC